MSDINMSDINAAQNLVDQLAAAQDWPEPDLLQTILDQGDAAIEPLLNVVCQDIHGWPQEGAVYCAAYLLGSLGAKSAIPALVEMFSRYDHDTLEAVSHALGYLGTDAIEPALQVALNSSLSWPRRAAAADAAIMAAGDDAALQEQVARPLRELLQDYVARADSLQDDEIQLVTSLVWDLAHLADPQARETIYAAFDAELVEEWVIGRDDIAYCYRQGGRMEQADPLNWLRIYRRAHDQHQAALRRREREAQEPQPQLAPQASTPQLGRNDLCWCGSGKKYKKCHLQADLDKKQPRE